LSSDAARSEPARNEPPRQMEVRVGSATSALQPLSSVERSHAPGRAQWVALAIVAAAAVVADQLTKWLVGSALSLGESFAVAGPFSIHHVRNTGIAFGLFSNETTGVIFVTTAAVGGMLVFFARAGQRHAMVPIALGLVLGGSISNLVDRVRLGHVTDFLDFDYWPAFNLADTFIVVGVALLFLSFVAADRTSPRVGDAPLSSR
jgi:signal peptidase II